MFTSKRGSLILSSNILGAEESQTFYYNIIIFACHLTLYIPHCTAHYELHSVHFTLINVMSAFLSTLNTL